MPTLSLLPVGKGAGPAPAFWSASILRDTWQGQDCPAGQVRPCPGLWMGQVCEPPQLRGGRPCFWSTGHTRGHKVHPGTRQGLSLPLIVIGQCALCVYS